MVASLSIEADIISNKARWDFTDTFLGELGALYGHPGSSQSRINQALREVNPFTHEHEPLRTLVRDLDAYCQSVAPIPVALKKPALIKQLLDEFLKTRKDILVHSCYVIEFTDDHSLFEGMRDGVARRTLNPA